MTSQQLKEELQEAWGINQVFIPQKDQSFAESLIKTAETHKPFKSLAKLKWRVHMNPGVWTQPHHS